MLRTKDFPAANTVASGKTSIFDLPPGNLYHVLWLIIGYDGTNASKETTGTAANQIVTDIRVKVNGKIVRVCTAKQLNEINSSNGSQYALQTEGTMGSSGYRERIPIFLAEPWREDIEEQQLPAWNIRREEVKSFQVEVDFATITSPVCEGYYEYEPARNTPLGAVTKWLRTSITVGGTSQDFGQFIERPEADFLQALHLFPSTGGQYVQKLLFSVNGTVIQAEAVNYLSQRAKLKARGMNPDTAAAPRWDQVLDYDDLLTSQLPLNGINEFIVKPTFSASASGTMDVVSLRSGTVL